MKILHVISALTVEAGGPPFVCAGLAKAQADLGHDITIATVDYPGKPLAAIDPRVKVESFPFRGSARYVHSPALARWLDENISNYNFVHLHSVWQFPTFAAARACWHKRVPYVVLLNGMMDTYSVYQHNAWLKQLYWMAREGRVLRRAQALHCLNQAEIRRAVDWIEGLPKFVIGNGVSRAEIQDLPLRGAFRARFPAIAQRPVVLFLSRIHPKKGLDRLLPQWADVSKRLPQSILVIAGTGDAPYVARIDALIKEHHLESSVLRVGQLEGRQKWEALVDSDLFVLPSHQEGFSMAITEAMAASLPVVITQECNFDEVETHSAGRIVRGGDMRRFTDDVVQLLEDPAQRTTLGAAGRRLVESRYTWDRIGADLIDVYRWALSGRTFTLGGRDIWRTAAAHQSRQYRVLHVIESLNPAIGGPATVASRLAAAQAAVGHDVTVLSYLGPEEQGVVHRMLEGVPFMERVKLEFIPKVGGWDRVLTVSARKQLARIVGQCDMIHLHGVWEPLLIVAASMARDSGVPYVVRACGMLDPWSLRQHWLKKRIALSMGYRYMLNEAAFLHALNRDEKHLIERLGLKCLMEVIPNGVFLDEIQRVPSADAFYKTHPTLAGKPYILFMARLHAKKGLDYLADAFAHVARHHPDVQLVVAGPDEGAQDGFTRRIAELHLQDRVHMVGPQYSQDKFAALAGATLFCLPSRQEGFSLAILEALACSIPAVISDACHFPEVAELHAGLVVPLDAQAIGAALLELLNDPARRAEMGRAGAELVRNRYTWPRVAQLVTEAYDRAHERRDYQKNKT